MLIRTGAYPQSLALVRIMHCDIFFFVILHTCLITIDILSIEQNVVAQGEMYYVLNLITVRR